MSKVKVLLLWLSVVIVVSTLSAQPNPSSSDAHPKKGFIQNKGQILDQKGRPASAVQFVLPLGNGLNVQLRKTGFSYDTYRHNEQSGNIDLQRIDVEFLFAGTEIEIQAEKPTPDLLHFPGRGVYNIQKFRKVVYRNVYPQIDIEFLADVAPGKPVEYNFILHPGACLADIQLAYSGMQQLELNGEKLQLSLAKGRLSERIPASFWSADREAVDVGYQILHQTAETATVGFSAAIGAIEQTLVIDPIPHLDWGTYLGGSDDDSSRDLVLDGAGNVFMVGNTGSMSAIATTGTHQNTLAGSLDALLAKFDNNGQLLWSTYFGGDDEELGQNVDLDAQGNIFISGTTKSTTGIATTGAAQEVYGGGENDAFVAKFDANGILRWASYLGGPGDDFSNALTSDLSGNVIIAGWTNSDSGIATAGSHQPANAGDLDAFLVKYDADGNLQWGSYYGDAGLDIGLQLETDQADNIYFSGWSSSTSGIATPGTHQDTFGGGFADAFLASFSPTGVRQWGTYYGGTGDDYGDALKLDAAGNIFFAGPTTSANAMATAGTHQPAIGGSGFDAFLVKFDPTAVRQWATYFGGSQDDTGYGIAFGTDGGVYLTGFTNSGDGIATPDAHQTAFAGGDWDGYWVKFDANGMRELGTYYGGSQTDEAYGIGVDANDQVFLTGVSGSDQDISTDDAHQSQFGGGSNDAFLARFSPCNEPVLDVPNGGYLCSNLPFVLELHFSEAGPYTFIYEIDGVEQPAVTTPDSVYMLSLTTAEYQDSVVITSISSGGCVGTEITGMPFIRVAEPLSSSNPTVDCDEGSQTYTVSVQLSGGMFAYTPVSPTSGLINGNTFTSDPIPFAQDYNLQITSGLQCDTLTFTGSSGCDAACPPLNIAVAGNGPICEGEDIILTADDGAVNYLWTGPANFSSTGQNPVITNVSASFSGTYQLVADDGNNCTETFTVDVLVNRMPVINNLDAPPLTCADNMTTLTVDASGVGVLEYALNGSAYSTQNSFPDLTPGNYNVAVRDETGCINESLVTLQTADGPVITAVEIVPPGCGETNGSVIITAVGQELPLEYSINDGGTFQADNTFDNLVGGEYPIIVRDQAGCTITAWATLSGGGEPPVIDEILIEQAACAENQNSITVNAVSGSNQLSYSINGVDFQQSNRFGDLLPGNYSVSVADENGCSATEVVNIPTLNVLVVEEVVSQAADCRGNTGSLEVVARGGSGILTYELDTLIQTDSEFEGLAPGTYLLTVTDDSGCSYTETVNIARTDCPIYIANAFSPNEDGVNDRFAVFAASGIDGQVISYQIFNRWGNQVYEASGFPLGDSGQWWDGNVQGRPVAAGTYIFYLVIELSNGERIVEQGEVNVVR